MSQRRVQPGPCGLQGLGLRPPHAPSVPQVQSAARGDWAGAFCQWTAHIYFSQVGTRKAGGLLSTQTLCNCFRSDSTLSQPLPPDLHSTPSILLQTLHQAPAVIEVFPSRVRGDMEDHAGPGADENTTARQHLLPAKQTLSPFQRWLPQEWRRATSPPPGGKGESTAPAAVFGLDGKVRSSTPRPLCFKSSNKVFTEEEQKTLLAHLTNSVPYRTIALTKMSPLLLHSKTPGLSMMPELVPACCSRM